MSNEQELPPELKAFEAELASLVPRTDGLDVGRLMFLAGQASAAGKQRRAAAAWSVALAAMTTVAATLLVMLITRPEPRAIERIVHVPIQPPPEVVVPNEKDDSGSREPSSPKRPAGPVDRTPAMAADSPGRLDWPDDRLPPPGAPYFRLRNMVLARGLDAWPPEEPATGSHPQTAPVSYRELLQSLLDEQG